MTISILGSGWLGLPLAKDLIKQGYDVKLSTRSEARLAELANSSTSAHIVDIEAMTETVVPFLNAGTLIINITSKQFDAYKQLITEIKKSTIKQVLFVSSTSVYQSIDRVVGEDDGLENPDSFLYQVEQLFRSNTTFKTTVVRLSGLIGYSRHPGRFFKSGKTVQQPDAAVNLIHRDDCIGIINRIIEQAAWGSVFNGCASTHPSKREFYSYARSLLKLAAPEFNESTACQFTKIVSNEKVIGNLGYTFKHPDIMASLVVSSSPSSSSE